MKLPVPCLLALFFLATVARGDAPPLNAQHPAVKKARLYVEAIVARDWKTCASMLLPAALEWKKSDALAALTSATHERRAELLEFYGVKSPADLERLSAGDFYVVERTATYRPQNLPLDSFARQLETLKTDLLSVAAEEENRFIHVLMRTHRETSDLRIHELMLISVLQDDSDQSRWHIVPDSLLPVAQPLGAAQKPLK